MPHFNIEKDVEITSAHKTRKSKNQDVIDLLLAMEVGDSFTIPNNRVISYDSVVAMLKRQGRANGRNWSKRKEDTVSSRIWRIK